MSESNRLLFKEEKYIITDGELFFDGCSRYGVDQDGILRVGKVKWSKKYHPFHAVCSQERVEKLLEGIKKYHDAFGNYRIRRVVSTTIIEE